MIMRWLITINEASLIHRLEWTLFVEDKYSSEQESYKQP